jgi:8-oxo-dGTP pyrophosphatase MutT (NUDIX family)
VSGSAERGGAQNIPRPPGSRPGLPAPWAELEAAARNVDLQGIRDALASGPPPATSPIERFGVRASAVLAPLYEEDGRVMVVLTRRADHLRSHKGEVSFPGGGMDAEDDDLRATALREAHEEIGLDPDSVEIIGELDHLSTVSSRSYIVPYVGVVPGRPELTPNPNEVAAVLHVPLSELLLEEVYREERWGWGVPLVDRPIYFFELVGDTVWGATASMLRGLLARATGTFDG